MATWLHGITAENLSLQQSESPISGLFVKLLILTLSQEKRIFIWVHCS
jgi:hypothetical protein